MPIFELLRPSKNTKISHSKRTFAIKPRGLFPELRYAYFRLKKMLKLCFYLIYLNLNLVKTSKFNTMQKTSTWQTHLPYLQVETLLQYRIHQSYTGNYHCMHWLSKTPSWVTKQVWCARNSPWSLHMGPRSHQCVNKQTKNWFFLLKFAC